MPGAMHEHMLALLHKAQYLAAQRDWRAPIVALVAGLLLRLAGRGHARLAAGLAVLAGWLALTWPATLWPTAAADRLPGLALLLVAYGFAAPRLGRGAIPLLAVVAAWWLRGAPLQGAALASVMPVFLGLLAVSFLVRRIAARDTGWTGIAAAASLAAAIYLAGGGLHWVRAALVPAAAGLALLGLTDSVAALQLATVLAAATVVVASDHGRLAPIDAAAAAPLLVWFLAPRLQPRLNRAGPALSGAAAAVFGLAIIWASLALLARR
jgi:hypothetical protein